MTSLSLAGVVQLSILVSGANTYVDAHQVSTKTGQPMVVMVGAAWCPACRTMKRNVLPQVRKRGLLRRVAFATVNLDRERQLGRKLTRGGPIPQLLMFRRTSDGWRVSRLIGGQNVRTVETFIGQGLKRDDETKKIETAREEPASKRSPTVNGVESAGKAPLASK